MSEQVVFEATFDGVWKVKVVRLEGYKGLLTVDSLTMHDSRDLFRLLEKEVGLSYGAVFGPDVGDLAEWEVMVAEAVDAHNAQGSHDDQRGVR